MFAALTRAADGRRAEGDLRTKGQIMADTLVERVTDQVSADDVPVTVDLVVSDAALLAGGAEPGHLMGYGPVPADLVRDVAGNAEARRALRRLYARPATGDLVSIESRARCFPPGLALMIRLRDQVCRTPWCHAPIRHIDHVTGVAQDGPTSAANGQGLCQACNHAKQALGWTARAGPDGLVTPIPSVAGAHATYPPGLSRPLPPPSRVELILGQVVLAC